MADLAISRNTGPLVARSDAQDRMVEADGRIAALQRGCGGTIPGMIAMPELIELVRKARGYGMRLGRALTMHHPTGSMSGWAEIEPADEGCVIRLFDWHESGHPPLADPEGELAGETRLAMERLLADAVLWLDEDHAIVALESGSAELSALGVRARKLRGESWTGLFRFDGETPPHWGARGGIIVGIDGIRGRWHLLLAGGASGSTGGHQVLIRRHEDGDAGAANDEDLLPDNLLSEALAPALAEPVRKVIRQGEIMRDRLAGPLAREYVNYAGDIVNAGEHLAGLAEDIARAGDEGAEPEPDLREIDLADLAESACRLQTTRAARRQARFSIAYDPARALADRRWCMQILLNLLGNAVSYGPKGGEIFVDCAQDADWASVTISDEGTPLTGEERERLFGKYERLGRPDKGREETGEQSGTGLGLHISRRLARAMGGELSVGPAVQGGNAFTLRLPAISRVLEPPEASAEPEAG